MIHPLYNFKTAAVLLLVAGLTGCNDHAETEKDSPVKLVSYADETAVLQNGELALNLCPDVVETSDATEGVHNAYEWIQKAPDQRFDTLREMIGDASIDLYYNEMVTNHPEHDCKGFFTGLKMFTGLQGTALRIYYVPAWFCTNETVSVADTVEFTITETTDTLFSDSGTLTNAVSAAADILYYQNNVVFHEASGTRTFNPSDGEAGDTKCVLVPFQLIKSLMKQNGHFILNIWHYAVKPSYTFPDARIRQSLLLGPEGIVPEMLTELIKQGKGDSLFFSAGFAGKYADRSHLCPPSCNKVSFIVSGGSADCQ